MTLLLAIITGFLVRADGWGDAPKYERFTKFFNVWTCAAFFFVAMLAYTISLSIAAASFAAFVLFRLSGFPKWQNWAAMLWRGFWPTAIGFALISYAAHGHIAYAWLATPFAAIYASIYALHRTKSWALLGFDKHVWIEHASGFAFAVFVGGIV